MDGRKRWADNIMVERGVRSLKQEEIYINKYRTPRELLHAIGEYIRKYNTIRPHQALENRTPDDVYYTPFSRLAINAAGLLIFRWRGCGGVRTKFSQPRGNPL